MVLLMLKILSILLILGSMLNASEEEYATKIIKNLVDVIDKSNTSVWVVSDDSDVRGSLKELNMAKTCKEAKVLILLSETNMPKYCLSKPILVLDYDLLEKHSNAVAAFFWQKGRPNIVFLKKRLQHFSISLPPTYEKYVEEQIW